MPDCISTSKKGNICGFLLIVAHFVTEHKQDSFKIIDEAEILGTIFNPVVPSGSTLVNLSLLYVASFTS